MEQDEDGEAPRLTPIEKLVEELDAGLVRSRRYTVLIEKLRQEADDLIRRANRQPKPRKP